MEIENMNKKLYIKLAYNNIKKDKNSFFPFLISVVTMAGVFYMLTSIWLRTGKDAFYGADNMEIVLHMGVIVTAMLSMGIVFYTNSFLMKRRTKELGLYNILGMEKKHIGHVVFWEIVIIAISGVILGLVAGVLLSRLMFLILLKMIGLKQILEFHVSAKAIGLTAGLFAGVFVLDIIYNRIHIARLKPIDMLQSNKQGEKEPKVKWLLVLLGAVCLGVGYYIAITTKNPIAAMSNFFIAVLLVIIGTYCLFIAVSILLLKMLKHNKDFYFHPTHFITISDMMYRMKQNAVGLANICIFSTAVLIVLSTTVSLFVGIDDEIRTRYPRNVQAAFYLKEKDLEQASDTEKKIDDYFQQQIQNSNVTIEGLRKFYQWETVGIKEGNRITLDEEEYTAENLAILTVMLDKQYNDLFGTDYQAQKGKGILLCEEKRNFPADSREIIIGNTVYPLQSVGTGIRNSIAESGYGMNILVLVSDLEEFSGLVHQVMGEKMEKEKGINYQYQFDLKGNEKEKKTFCEKIEDTIKKTALPDNYVEDSISGRKNAMAIYAGLLFIGIFIGILFLIATVLIIYYKQISEGFEDRNNFLILQKVGLSKQEVKKIINSQMKMVFYLPILVAVVHIIAAFPLVKRMLLMLNLANVPLFIGCTIGTAIVFFLFYTVVYRLTSGVYYRIVNK